MVWVKERKETIKKTRKAEGFIRKISFQIFFLLSFFPSFPSLIFLSCFFLMIKKNYTSSFCYEAGEDTIGLSFIFIFLLLLLVLGSGVLLGRLGVDAGGGEFD